MHILVAIGDVKANLSKTWVNQLSDKKRRRGVILIKGENNEKNK